MRRCFTDPHYWKNPAFRRSREKQSNAFRFYKKMDLDNIYIYIYNFMHHDSCEHANINPHGSMIPHHLMDSLPSFPTASQEVPEQPKDCQGFFGLVIPKNLPQIPATKRGILITMISYNMIISLYHGLYHYSYHDIPSL